MDPERFRQIEELYHAAAERPVEQRASILAQADPEIRREVEALLAQPDGGTLLSRPAADLLAETTVTQMGVGAVWGSYRIENEIGAGGMGVVYRALDTKLNRPVAIKVLSQELADADARRRFQREAQMASSLNHPHILTVHDAGEIDGRQYLVTEYIDGGTLNHWAKSEKREWRDAVELLVGVADGLATAHEAGILHRDIKPANILITKSGYAKLADFGLAKLAEQPDRADSTRSLTDHLTRRGTVIGTIAYMSPEQASAKALDTRSDIFSFGVVLYQMVAGRRPFEGASDLETLQMILHAAPQPLPENIPQPVRAVVEKALQKDPAERYQSMREMIVDQRRLLRQNAEMLEASTRAPERLAVRHERTKYRAWLAACATVVLLAVGAGGIYQWVKAKAHTPDPQAYQLYVQGRHHIQEYTEHGFKQSVVDFQNAIQRDPEYAAAYAGLADAYSYLAEFEIERPKDVMPLAESNAAKAIEKDPRTAEAYTSLGIVALGYYWDFPLAEQRFRRAIKLNPRDAFTQHFLGHSYEFMGKWQDALNQMRLALDIEKLSPIYGEDLAYDLLANSRNDDAIRQLRETVGLAPQDPYALALLAIALEATGKTAESLDQAEQAVKLPGMFLTAGSLAGIFCRLHRPDMAQDILKQLEVVEQAGTYVAPLEFAMVHFAFGDKKRGLAQMTEALKDHSINIAFDIADPVFDLVREDPEFAALMAKMHLPPACWHDVPRYRK